MLLNTLNDRSAAGSWLEYSDFYLNERIPVDVDIYSNWQA